MRLQAVSLLFLVACSSSGEDRGLAGKWTGTSSVAQRYEFTIADHDGALSGAGVVDPGNLAGDPISVEVTGAVAGPDVSLRFDAGGMSNALAFTGVVVDPDHLSGLIESDTSVSLDLSRIADTDPPEQPDGWQQAEDRLVDARCHAECGTPAPDCESATHTEMAQARIELADADEPQCIACMNALAAMLDSTQQPSCMPTGSEDVFEICDAEINGTMVTLHACNGHPDLTPQQ